MDSGIFILAPYQTGSPSRRLTRRSKVQPASLFTPQDRNLSPEAHFPLQTVSGPDRAPFPRFINRFNSREILLVVDGSCINNGRHANKLQDPVGGCSFIFKGGSTTPSLSLRDTTKPPIPVTFPFSGSGTTTTTTTTTTINNNDTQKWEPRPPGAIAFRLENHGPSGIPAEPTSNRAKLRAVIAALQFRAWGAEGWRRVVVLTDLEYIVWGATRWLPRWVAKRWRKPRGQGRYQNRDLWEELQHQVEELRGEGCEVSFWLAGHGREGEGEGDGERVIAQAKMAAQRAARGLEGEEVERFTKLCGVMV